MLAESGVEDMVILEASNRVGGRIRKEHFGGVSVELDAGWIAGIGDPQRNPVWELAVQFGLRTCFSDYTNAGTSRDDVVSNFHSVLLSLTLLHVVLLVVSAGTSFRVESLLTRTKRRWTRRFRSCGARRRKERRQKLFSTHLETKEDEETPPLDNVLEDDLENILDDIPLEEWYEQETSFSQTLGLQASPETIQTNEFKLDTQSTLDSIVQTTDVTLHKERNYLRPSQFFNRRDNQGIPLLTKASPSGKGYTYFVLLTGPHKGIFTKFADLCMAKEGLANPRYKGFYTKEEADKALDIKKGIICALHNFLTADNQGIPLLTKASPSGKGYTYFVLLTGPHKGIFTKFADLCMAKEGLANPRYKGFYTKEEADKALEFSMSSSFADIMDKGKRLASPDKDSSDESTGSYKRKTFSLENSINPLLNMSDSVSRIKLPSQNCSRSSLLGCKNFPSFLLGTTAYKLLKECPVTLDQQVLLTSINRANTHKTKQNALTALNGIFTNKTKN
ncbi:hypothetical protein Fmac_026478 [Flemingia macrophylla]|uniref:Amine oxidase domain-containing protein n=1 Tax=Flemingia macrophylla TaxID=520843 RepID=A0ABD1LEZ8_9FABA